MLTAFQENPLLLLFTVIALGYGLGSVRIRGAKLGVAAVLFVGLGFGAIDPDFSVPEIVIFLGLTMFVYTVGLSSGPAFFASFRQHGFRDIFFVLAVMILSAALAAGLHYWLGFDAATTAGVFAGASTNTPALAGLLDLIQKTAPTSELTQLSQRAVVGYSLAYPMGVLGVMFAIWLMRRITRIDYAREAESLQRDFPIGERIQSRTVLIEQPDAIGQSIRDFSSDHPIRIVFGRVKHDGDEMRLTSWDYIMGAGDRIVIIGPEHALEEATALLGRRLPEDLTTDRSVYDIRRLFVSNPDLAGKTIAALNLPERFAATVTRVQRGDMDLLAGGDTVLELGDRVLVVARRRDLKALFTVFGNSYEALSTINLLSFGLGMAAGLLLGMISIALPGGFTFNLGFAGGPLIVALVLGQLRRTGPIVWTLPYSANLTLRQMGLILLLAGIGIRSGNTFLTTILAGGGGPLFLAGAVIAISTAVTILAGGFWVLRIPFSFLTGMVASQPAVLDYALEQAGNKYPLIGYTRMLPVILITKILFVQVLFAVLGG